MESSNTASDISKTKSFWINVIIFLNFFPFFKIIPVIEAEIQPIAGVVSIIYIFVYDLLDKQRQKLYAKAYPFIIIIIAYLLAAFFFIFSGSRLELSYIVQALSIFIAPLVVYLVLNERMNLISLKMFRWSLYSWFGLTFLQAAFPGLLNATGISLVLGAVTSRFSAEAGVNDRGVGGFAPEPSYSAHIILLMFAIAIFLYRKQRITRRESIVMICCSLFMVVANQSATVGSFFILFIVAYGFWEILQGGKGKIYFILGLIVFMAIGLVGIAFFPQALLQIRFFAIFADILGIGSSGRSAGFDIAEISDSYGSVRALGVQFGYECLSLTNGFGLGLGGYGPYSMELAKRSKVGELSPLIFTYGDDVPIKPYSYGSFVAMDLGLLGLVTLSLMFFWSIVMNLKKVKKISPYAFACFVLFVMGVYFNQPTSLPAHWLLLLLAFEDLSNEGVNSKVSNHQVI
jgi:hypothetical protein